MQLAGHLDNPKLNAQRVASDLMLLDSDSQHKLGDLVFEVISLFAELGEIWTDPRHPLATEYRTARALIAGLARPDIL
jgi:hypothetical protein